MSESQYDAYLDEKDAVWLILAPAVRWFKDRPNCIDATEALARAQTARALIEWYQCLPEPTAEEAEEETVQTAQTVHAHELQSGDVIDAGQVQAHRITVTGVTVRPDNFIEIQGLIEVGEGERVADSWLFGRLQLVRVLR